MCFFYNYPNRFNPIILLVLSHEAFHPKPRSNVYVPCALCVNWLVIIIINVKKFCLNFSINIFYFSKVTIFCVKIHSFFIFFKETLVYPLLTLLNQCLHLLVFTATLGQAGLAKKQFFMVVNTFAVRFHVKEKERPFFMTQVCH